MPGQLVEVQPERQPLDCTHYDCWPDQTDWDGPGNLAFVKKLLNGWAEDFNLPQLIPLAILYLESGQVTFMRDVAQIFVDAGYDVYDGDEFFEIYKHVEEDM